LFIIIIIFEIIKKISFLEMQILKFPAILLAERCWSFSGGLVAQIMVGWMITDVVKTAEKVLECLDCMNPMTFSKG